MAILNKIMLGMIFLLMINFVSATITYAPHEQINNIIFYDNSAGTYSRIGGYGNAIDYFPDDAQVNDSLVFVSSTYGAMVDDEYVGKFKGIELNISTPLSATDINITWEYARAYDGSSSNSEWKTLNYIDNCNNFQNTGVCNITWEKATDQNNYFRIMIDGSFIYYSYWVRARITGVDTITEGGKQSTSDLNIIHEAIKVEGQNITMKELLNESQTNGWDCVSGIEGSYILDCNLFLESDVFINSKSESVTFGTNWEFENLGGAVFGELIGTSTINKATWRFMQETNSYYATRFAGYIPGTGFYGNDILFTETENSLRRHGAWGGNVGVSYHKLLNFYGEGFRQLSASVISTDFFGLRGQYPFEGTGGTIFDFKPSYVSYAVRFSGSGANNDYIHQSDFSGAYNYPINNYIGTNYPSVNSYLVDMEYGTYAPEDRTSWVHSTSANLTSETSNWDLSSILLKVTDTQDNGLSEARINITDSQNGTYDLITNPDGYLSMGNSSRYYGNITSIYDSVTFCDSSQSWDAYEFKNKELYFTSGTGAGNRYIIKSYSSTSCLRIANGFKVTPDTTTKYVIIPHLINKRYQPTEINPGSTTYGANVTYYNTYNMKIAKDGYKDLETTFSLEKGLDTFIALEEQPPWNYSIAPKFLIRNETTSGIFKISPEGNLAIAGELHENTNSPPLNKILWQIGDLIYLTEKGDLYIKGVQVW